MAILEAGELEGEEDRQLVPHQAGSAVDEYLSK